MNLFDEPDMSRADKMRISRKATNELTKKAVEYLNETGQFHVTRSNNIPSTRLTKEIRKFEAFDKDGNAVVFEYEHKEVRFKKHNVKEAILDISGFTLKMPGITGGGIHVEIEVKTGKDALSEEQIKRMKTIKDAGGITFAFNSMETLKHQIKPYLRELPLPF